MRIVRPCQESLLGISESRQALDFRPLRYNRCSQALEVTLAEVMARGEPPLLKWRKGLTREQAIKLWRYKRRAGWRACPPQWSPPQPPRA